MGSRLAWFIHQVYIFLSLNLYPVCCVNNSEHKVLPPSEWTGDKSLILHQYQRSSPLVTYSIHAMNTSIREKQFESAIRQLTEKYVTMWNGFPDVEPELLRRFSQRQQRENERRLETQLKLYSFHEAEQDALSPERSHFSFEVIKAIVGSSFVSGDIINDNFFTDSERITKRFFKDARELDSSLSHDDIHQALRNLWVFNSLQQIRGTDVVLTPSSFAYSLLYPITDNGLDSTERTPPEKEAYIHWLSQWFLGNKCAAADGWTERTAALLRMIENEYPPSEFLDVYLSLRAIHHAQAKSLFLHNVRSGSNETSLTKITIEKGGTSVLADGFLTSGMLNDAEIDSFFEYGVLLQFVDDIRDIHEDRINGHSSPFSRIADSSDLDSAARRLLFFVKHCGEKLSSLNHSHARQIKQMVEQSCTFLILESAAHHREYYSSKFIQNVERSLPMSPAFLDELRHEVEYRQMKNSGRFAFSNVCAGAPFTE